MTSPGLVPLSVLGSCREICSCAEVVTAQLPNRQATNGELAENTTQPNLPVYTPVLTNSYPLPLPTELRYPQSSAWEERVHHQRTDEFRAAKWALKQLEKSSPPGNADE